MATKHLDARRLNPLQPATALWAAYRPGAAPHAFRARSPAAARQWQARTRAALAAQVGLTAEAPVALKPRVLERIPCGDHVREKILLQTAPGVLMPVYLLIPNALTAPAPVMLAFHGHGYGVKDIVGLWEDGQERSTPENYHWDFAVALCRAGFVVAAPEISCFGERQTDFTYLDKRLGQVEPSTCAHASFLASHLGTTVVAMRVRDGMRLVDYLATRREVDLARLGAMGISGGGMHTLFSTCLDTRIKACVVSGYFATFRDSILAMHHCACNFVPGLGRFGEMADLAGLIAPRPMLVESGTRDPLFPLSAVRKGVRHARAIYRVFGAASALQTDEFEGRHQIHGVKAYPFLQHCLRRA